MREAAIVRPQEPGARPNGLVELIHTVSNPLSGIASFVQKTLVIAELEARKLRHDPTELLTRAVQPALWLVIFGEVFTKTKAIPTPGQIRYLDFIAPGILAQSGLFIAIFSGITIIWERDLGIIHKFLVSPTSREALALGKALAGSLRALSQVVVIYLLSIALGVKLNWNPLGLVGVLVAVVLAAAAFCAFSLIIAFIVKTRERFMGIGQLLTMPFFFASSAIYPISIMPRPLQVIAHGNPLTYEVDALRTLMLPSGTSTYGLGVDFGVLLFATAVMVTVAAQLYPRAAT
jgi:ABC-2 type transport system permease protein